MRSSPTRPGRTLLCLPPLTGSKRPASRFRRAPAIPTRTSWRPTRRPIRWWPGAATRRIRRPSSPIVHAGRAGHGARRAGADQRLRHRQPLHAGSAAPPSGPAARYRRGGAHGDGRRTGGHARRRRARSAHQRAVRRRHRFRRDGDPGAAHRRPGLAHAVPDGCAPAARADAAHAQAGAGRDRSHGPHAGGAAHGQRGLSGHAPLLREHGWWAKLSGAYRISERHDSHDDVTPGRGR